MMSKEYKLVPVEPTEEMIIVFSEAWYSKRQAIDDPDMLDAYTAMLAAAPQPPALGGELKTLAWIYCEDQEKKIDWFVGALEEVPVNTALIDRAHYDAQQAEIERLKDEVTTLSCIVDECGKERDQLKARNAELEGLCQQVKEAHAFLLLCRADATDTAIETGAMRDAYNWLRTAAENLGAALAGSEQV